MQLLFQSDVTPVAYWSMEDGSGAKAFSYWGGSLANANNGTWGAVAPSLAADGTAFPGSDAIPQFNNAALTFGSISGGGTPTSNCVRFALAVPKGGDSSAGSSNWNVLHIATGGTIASLDVYLTPAGKLQLQALNGSGGTIFTSTGTHDYRNVPILMSAEMTASGGTISVALRTIAPGGTSNIESITGSTTGTIGAVTLILVSRAGALSNTAGGQLSLHYDVPSLTSAAAALGGHSGETALARFVRICAEQGIASETIGSSSVAMGPQIDDSLANVLQSIENSDQGLLYETRDQMGLGYIAYSAMLNQSPALTVNYAAGQVGSIPVPTYDDQYINNDVTLVNWDGYTYQLQLVSGSRSILPPPNGVGDYPSGQAVAVSLANDSDVATIARRVLNLGVSNALRIPSLTVNLASPHSASLFSAAPTAFIGSYVQLTNPPSWLTPSTAKLLIWGYTETLSTFTWTIAYNTVPEAPFESAYAPGSTHGAQSVGTPVTGAQSGSGAFTGAQIGAGAVTPATVSTGVSYTIGGSVITPSSSAPPAPAVNDIWINTSNGYQLNQWDGSQWNPISWTGDSVLAPGTVGSSSITVAAITAGLIAAGAINGQSITAASIGTASLTASTINGSVITSSSMVLDDQSDGTILVYAKTSTTTTYTSGSGNWPCPAGTLYAIVQCRGGGASGNLAPGTPFSSAGGNAGGGGEFAEELQLAVTPGNSYPYVVGAGGAATPAGGTFNNPGGTSTFAGDSVTVVANGGWGGFATQETQPGHGSTNSIHFDGGYGGRGFFTSGPTTLGGGGGAGGGNTASGANGADATSVSGTGGIGAGGGGNGGRGYTGTTAGAVATAPGGGGGGGDTAIAGAGAAGQVSVTAVSLVLLASISPVAGTDSYSNTYPEGIMAALLTLTGIVTPPTPAALTSSLYSTSAGTPGAILPSGSMWQTVLSQSDNSINSVTVTTFANLTKQYPIPAGDANVGTIYRLSAWGDLVTGTTCFVTSWDIVAFGSAFAIVQADRFWLQASTTYEWFMTCIIQVTSVGITGNVEGWINGAISMYSVNLNGTLTTQGTQPLVSATGGTAANTASATTIGMQAKFATAIANQKMRCLGSTLERVGN
jgi:hypothetical protein